MWYYVITSFNTRVLYFIRQTRRIVPISYGPCATQMPPLALLKVIFGALSRNDLDALMMVNVSFREIVLRDFPNEPFRYFTSLCIDGYQSYRFDLTARNDYLCADNDDFGRRMRLARIGDLK